MRVYNALRMGLLVKGSVIIYKGNDEHVMAEVHRIINNVLISVVDNDRDRYLGGDEEIIVVSELVRQAKIFRRVTGLSPESFMQCNGHCEGEGD